MASQKRKNFRRRRESSDEEEESVQEVSSILEEAKEAQKFRQRPKGVSAAALALGKKLSGNAALVNDPFKLRTGGFVDMKAIKDRNRDRTGEEDDKDLSDLGTSFSAETNTRDEHAEMMKYIEVEMKNRKGQEKEKEASQAKIKGAEDLLYELPDRLKAATSTRSEEMLSNQMLSGIPEVDLGIEEKIRNIEATEDAKQRLQEQMRKKKDKGTSFVPVNMAVNYVQHNRFYREDTETKKVVKQEAPKPRPLKVGDTEPPVMEETSQTKKRPGERATDDFHFEKFKKQMTRRF
ncbi:splicing factor C9orf78 homolog [Branchiostoma floridae x Branchiostoma belcheri]